MNEIDFDNAKQFAQVLEALFLAADQALSLERIAGLFAQEQRPSAEQIQAGLERLALSLKQRSYELKQVASGYRLQIRAKYAPWVGRLSEERPQRYSRAMLETLALIAYRQPITRGEIEEVRGVAVNTQIIKTLLEREWVRTVGYKDVPGKPELLATTQTFLDYFNLGGLDELPNRFDLDKVKDKAMEQAAAAVPAQVGAGALEKESVHSSSQISFNTLLEELESMEHGLKTEFIDPAADCESNAVERLTGNPEL